MGVPNLPGVPPLASYAPQAAIASALMLADAVGLFAGAQPEQWGIFLNGRPVVLADNVLSFTYKSEFAIADYPIEQGGFETYDKVTIPFDVRFRFSCGGSLANRAAFLAGLDTIAPDRTNLYTAVSPEKTYGPVTVSHVDYNRTARDVGLITADVWCLNIRVSGASPFQSTASPSGADPANGGTVQATSPTIAEDQSGPAIASSNYTPAEALAAGEQPL